jgi:hypothetical protein
VAALQLFLFQRETYYFFDMEPGLYSAMMNVIHYIVGQTFSSTTDSQFKRVCLPAAYAAETNRSTWKLVTMQKSRYVQEQGHEGNSPASANSTSRSRLACQVNIPRFIKDGGTWWGSWSRYCATSRKVAGSISDVILPAALSPSVQFTL